jgi:hypothetical protein
MLLLLDGWMRAAGIQLFAWRLFVVVVVNETPIRAGRTMMMWTG